MSNVRRDFTGIEYRPRSYDSRVDTTKIGYTERLASGVLYHLQNWTTFNDQICLTRATGVTKKSLLGYDVKEVETVSTGVTRGMVERFIKGETTVGDDEKIKSMLRSALNLNLDDLSENHLRVLSRFFLQGNNNLEIIKKILTIHESQSPWSILEYVSFTIAALKPINQNTWNAILASRNPQQILGFLILMPDLLKLETTHFEMILPRDDANDILMCLGNHPVLVSDEGIMSNFDEILSLDNPSSLLEDLSRRQVVDWSDLSIRKNYDDLLRSGKSPFSSLLRVLLKIPTARHKLIEILHLLYDNPKLLNLGSNNLEKIFNMPECLGILKNFSEFPKINELLSDPTLLTTILDSELVKKQLSTNPRGAGLLLYALVSFPEFVEGVAPEILGQIISSPEPYDLLKTLAENPNLLKNKTINGYWHKILSSNDPVKTIVFVNDHIDLVEDGKTTMEVLVEIGILPEAIKMVKELEGLPEIMKNAALWEEVLKSKNPARVLGFFIDNRKYGQYITISPEGYSRGETKVYLNRNQFLNDATIDLWNVLTRREGKIDEDAWALVKADLADIFDKVYQERENERDRLFKFLEQCMGTADAMTSFVGKQVIRKRVDAIVNVLKRYLTKMESPDLSKEEKEKIKKMIGRTLDIMAMGGTACPDNAIVLLRQAENHIKLFEYPQYLANVIVNMFKLYSITETLIDKDNAENVETYLSYSLKLSNLLGLGVSGAMLYEEHYGKTEPFNIALPKLSARFTEAELIKFAVELEEFRSFFEEEKDKAVKAKEEEYLDADEDWRDAEDYPRGPKAQEKFAIAEKINKEIEDIKNSFFQNKARQLFVDAGFFVAT